ncbi:glyoxylate/hydroxypyruvate reductase A [Novosphingobium sp. 1949]|uniref:Glyoxylate/hydroxypyruvate reductase A n=1 Tax=Novosphingobium organovorum TaxID=2930092 RepID=A0ABT0BDS6_9SPHN|nr:glyoxylate/hydroxypyruvate reductase A [Novosphingobium organovorum]MCJ2182954.1 glyoxylate/hydroxypyruvate reductase A [Novosphingobium organovorum]
MTTPKPPVLLHFGSPPRGARWAQILPAHVPGIEVRQWPDGGDLAQVDYLAAWTLPEDIFARVPNARFVMSVGAGVDQLDISRIPPHLPLLRTVDRTMAQDMNAFVAAHVLALHRDLYDYRESAAQREWQPRADIPAAQRRVGVMGLGHLGKSVLLALAPFGFALSGWASSQHAIEGVTCFSGPDGLPGFLGDLDILICLLPLTEETRSVLGRTLFDALPRGASIINVGRGPHLVEEDLLAALESGQIGRAILDVFNVEPLPADSPLWAHPRIEITPHIACSSHPEASALCVAAAINADLQGLPLPDRVDRSRSY